MLSFFNKRKIKIGDYYLKLDISNPHEKQYFKSVENSDYFIANRLIKKGDRVLDLGANIGFTALLYLSFGAEEVYAFEPVPDLAKRILKLDCLRIKVFEYAISDAEDVTEIFLSTKHNQGHSLNQEWPERFSDVFAKKKRLEVKTINLDKILSNEVFDFIKIDVEGTEEKAIRGGIEFFKLNKNAIVQIEIYDFQFDSTHTLLSQFYRYTYLPVFGKENRLEFIQVSNLKEAKELPLLGPPNYIYSNSPL